MAKGIPIDKITIQNRNVGDLRKQFCLNYICSEKVTIHHHILIGKRIALIVHLYYTDLIQRCFEYIKEVPSDIDIYITTNKKENVCYIKDYIEKNNLTNVEILLVKNRGREISALLVGCRNIVKNYEYIGFVHDKKKNAQQLYQTIGQSFMDVLWENSIKNSIYIKNVIARFEGEPQLGFLSPGTPYVSSFFSVGSLAWSGCFINAEKLVKRLKLNCVLEEDKPPFTLGTVFWCRTEALRPLLEEEWRYEDFDVEPMAIDNTISHAIERIFAYVAQSQGYYSGVMMCNEYASLYMSNYRHMLKKVANLYLSSNEYIEYNNLEDREERLWNRCRGYKKIYIYGAGEDARSCNNTVILKYGLDIEGFVVSRGHKKTSEFYNKQVYEINEIEPNVDTLIILAINRENRKQVKPELIKRGFKNIEYFR